MLRFQCHAAARRGSFRGASQRYEERSGFSPHPIKSGRIAGFTRGLALHMLYPVSGYQKEEVCGVKRCCVNTVSGCHRNITGSWCHVACGRDCHRAHMAVSKGTSGKDGQPILIHFPGFRRLPCISSPEVIAAQQEAIVTWEGSWNRLPCLQIPLIILHGSKDIVTPRRMPVSFQGRWMGQ